MINGKEELEIEEGILFRVSNKVGCASFMHPDQGEVELWTYREGLRAWGYGISGFRSGGIEEALNMAEAELRANILRVEREVMMQRGNHEERL